MTIELAAESIKGLVTLRLTTRPRIAVFLGAGASAGVGLPTFDAFKSALAREVPDRPPDEGDDRSRLAVLLDLAKLQDPAEALQTMRGLIVTPAPPATPHVVASAALASGDCVFTVNWDDLVEKACSEHGIQIHVVMPTETTPCACALGHLYKLHGHPHLGLSAAPSRAPAAMRERLRSALAERDVAIYGYSARDSDLRDYLMDALKKARSFVWFCLPADSVALIQLLERSVGVDPTVHAVEDPAPLLAAWAAPMR